MYEALRNGIEKLNMKVVDIYKQNFVEIIISISFFRIPEFREKFLKIILEKSNDPIEEWRNTEGFHLEQDYDEDEELHHNPVMKRIFDWQVFFYDWIPQE